MFSTLYSWWNKFISTYSNIHAIYWYVEDVEKLIYNSATILS